jgi:hypothetical protein
MGFSINEATPIAGWFTMENPMKKWMIRVPYDLGKLHVCVVLTLGNLKQLGFDDCK